MPIVETFFPIQTYWFNIVQLYFEKHPERSVLLFFTTAISYIMWTLHEIELTSIKFTPHVAAIVI